MMGCDMINDWDWSRVGSENWG